MVWALLMAALPALLLAQQPTPTSTATRQATAQRLDTLPLLFNLAPTPEKTQIDADTFPDANFRMYDHTRRQPVPADHRMVRVAQFEGRREPPGATNGE